MIETQSHAELFEIAAVRFIELRESGQSEDQALEVVTGAVEFGAIADRIRLSVECFVDFAWDMCG